MIIIGSRKSKLAMWQTLTVADALNENGMETRINSMETRGDRILDVSIAKIGSKGVFTEELEEQLASGTTDIAVHSAKDMQSSLPEGFALIAFMEREKVNDVLVSRNRTIDLEDPSRPVRIGTSSVRRKALLRHYYPHVETVEMRGNLQTRIAKMDNGDCDALMLAYAGVKRMKYDGLIVMEFDEMKFIPPVGQGCIAIEAATSLDSVKLSRIRDCLNDVDSEVCLLAERAFLKKLEGGCSIPAFGLAVLEGNEIILHAGLASLDGQHIIRRKEKGARKDAEKIGKRAGEYILENGGREMLSEIRRQQKD
ncbi:hydroxymethylbilane synthase [Desulfomarina sp.]